MFKLMVAVIAALALTTQLPPSPINSASESSVEVIGTMVQYVKGTKLVRSQEDTLICSGFVVAPGLIMTARHCVIPSKERTPLGILITKPFVKLVKFKDTNTAEILHYTYSSDADVALIYADTYNHLPVKFQSHVTQGENVFVYGAPDGNEWVYSNAYIMQGEVPVVTGGEDAQYNWDGTYMIDCPSCFGGDSGGAVFNLSGDVVGMIVGMESSPEAGLMEPTVILQKELNALR